MTLFNTHRKCMVCKETTTDMHKDKCSCGAFMYPVGHVIVPTVPVKKSDVVKTAAS